MNQGNKFCYLLRKNESISISPCLPLSGFIKPLLVVAIKPVG